MDWPHDHPKKHPHPLAPHTKHGGVISLTRAEYERVRAADGRIG
ncbi:hypothetical protein [Bifidobacterium pullorum]|nr:hypothetical protein [Bifidobacterium pullorum]